MDFSDSDEDIQEDAIFTFHEKDRDFYEKFKFNIEFLKSMSGKEVKVQMFKGEMKEYGIEESNIYDIYFGDFRIDEIPGSSLSVKQKIMML